MKKKRREGAFAAVYEGLTNDRWQGGRRGSLSAGKDPIHYLCHIWWMRKRKGGFILIW